MLHGFTGHGSGLSNATMAGFPHFEGCVFTGEFPIAEIDFDDAAFPGKPKLTAFNPLIPLNPRDSSIPAAFFGFTVENNTQDSIDYTLAATLRNPRDRSVNSFRSGDGLSAMFESHADAAPDAFDRCDMTLATDETDGVSYQEYWYRGGWWDHLETYWRNFTEHSVLQNRRYDSPGRCDFGSLYIKKTAAPGEKVSFRVVISWSCPNRSNFG